MEYNNEDNSKNNSHNSGNKDSDSNYSETKKSQYSEEFDEVRKDALKEATKETIRLQRQNTKKLNDLIHKSENVLLKVRNIIPIFTDEIVIETSKITVIKRPFFFSEKIHSISVKDITDVYIETAPFFANINIIDANFSETSIRISWFLKKNAEKARRIITGLMESAKEGIDLKHLSDHKLGEKLEEVGKVRETKTSVSSA
jgi:hypothetical protein